jgi:hypothetical protein
MEVSDCLFDVWEFIDIDDGVHIAFDESSGVVAIFCWGGTL